MIRRVIRNPEQQRAEAARRMEGFQYTCLAQNDHVEVWRCKRPQDWHYHFDITVTLTGMAVTGDMTGMLFSVGSRYGIPFLRHSDKCYVAEKLEEQSRLKEFDKDAFLAEVARYAARRVEQIVVNDADEAPEGLDLPDWVRENYDESCTFEDVRLWVQKAAENEDHLEGNQRSDLEALAWALDAANDIENAQHAYDLLAENDALQAIDYFECPLERLAEGLVQRLYMLERAAEAIVAIKAQAPGMEVAHG